MARQNREKTLLNSWQALKKSVSPGQGWSTIALDTRTIPQIRVACYHPGGLEALLFGFRIPGLPQGWFMPDCQGFKVVGVDAPTDGTIWLGLHRQPSGPFEMFLKMAVDILDTLDKHSNTSERTVFDIFVHRLRAWQKFMELEGNEISREVITGLCGELEILGEMLRTGLSPFGAVSAWTGPLGSLHDFTFMGGVVEVKSTAASSPNIVQIASAEQLDTQIAAPIYLATCHFSRDENGIELATRMREIVNLISSDSTARNLFDSRLLHLGIDHNTDLGTDKYLLLSSNIFLVDDNFPKLVSSKLPTAVCNVRYSLDISMINQARITIREALSQIGAVK